MLRGKDKFSSFITLLALRARQIFNFKKRRILRKKSKTKYVAINFKV